MKIENISILRKLQGRELKILTKYCTREFQLISSGNKKNKQTTSTLHASMR